jgi:hypothetical protein
MIWYIEELALSKKKKRGGSKLLKPAGCGAPRDIKYLYALKRALL